MGDDLSSWLDTRTLAGRWFTPPRVSLNCSSHSSARCLGCLRCRARWVGGGAARMWNMSGALVKMAAAIDRFMKGAFNGVQGAGGHGGAQLPVDAQPLRGPVYAHPYLLARPSLLARPISASRTSRPLAGGRGVSANAIATVIGWQQHHSQIAAAVSRALGHTHHQETIPTHTSPPARRRTLRHGGRRRWQRGRGGTPPPPLLPRPGRSPAGSTCNYIA